MLEIAPKVFINPAEIKFSFIRAPGPGGQNVNKVASAVLLRFNLRTASLPEDVKLRLFNKLRKKLTQEGDLILKATRFRTQERNKKDALARLQLMLSKAALIPKKRKKTKPTFASTQKRLAQKKTHGRHKALRGMIKPE